MPSVLEGLEISGDSNTNTERTMKPSTKTRLRGKIRQLRGKAQEVAGKIEEKSGELQAKNEKRKRNEEES